MTSRRFEDAPKAIKNLKRSIEELKQRTSRKGHGHILGYAEVTTEQTGIDSNEVDLTGLSVTVSGLMGRQVKVTGSAQFYSPSSSIGRQGRLLIRADGNLQTYSNTGTDLPQGSALAEDALAIVTVSPSSDSVTFKLAADRLQGATTITMYAVATRPAFILIEDIGPA